MLSKFDWDDAYSVGVYHLDEDHKTLFLLAGTIAKILSERVGNPIEEEVFDEIIIFTKYHFNNEEEMMEKTGYPDIESHKEHHEKLIRQIEDYAKRIVNEDSSVEEATNFLMSWLIDHIESEDKKYTGHFHSHDQF